MRCGTMGLALLVLASPGGLRGQGGPPVRLGPRLRVFYACAHRTNAFGEPLSAIDCRTIRGRLLDVTTDNLSLAPGNGRAVWVALPLVARTEISLGRRASGQSVALGAVAGLVVGGLLGAGLGRASDPPNCYECAGASWGPIVGIGLGLPLGLLVGAAVGTERWQEVSLSDLSSRLAPHLR